MENKEQNVQILTFTPGEILTVNVHQRGQRKWMLTLANMDDRVLQLELNLSNEQIQQLEDGIRGRRYLNVTDEGVTTCTSSV